MKRLLRQWRTGPKALGMAGQKLIRDTIYKLIKEDPTADIVEALTAPEEEYNSGG